MCNFFVIGSSSNAETLESLRTFNMMTDYLKYAVKHFGFRNTYALKTVMKNGYIPQQEQCLESLAHPSLLTMMINCMYRTLYAQFLCRCFLVWFGGFLNQKNLLHTFFPLFSLFFFPFLFLPHHYECVDPFLY